MKYADPRKVVFKFYYPNETITMTMQEFNMKIVKEDVIRICIDVEDIKQINITNFNLIMLVISGANKANVDGEMLNIGRALLILKSTNGIVTKEKVMLAEIGGQEIGNIIVEDIEPDVNQSLWITGG